jgi:hypothetical protein
MAERFGSQNIWLMYCEYEYLICGIGALPAMFNGLLLQTVKTELGFWREAGESAYSTAMKTTG